jgi:hypothetical protein
VLGQRLAPGELAGAERLRQLEQGQGVAAGLVDQPVPDHGAEPAELRLQQPAGRLGVEPADGELGQAGGVEPADGGVTGGHQQRHPLLVQSPAHEHQGVGRGPVEPLGVVDQQQDRPQQLVQGGEGLLDLGLDPEGAQQVEVAGLPAGEATLPHRGTRLGLQDAGVGTGPDLGQLEAAVGQHQPTLPAPRPADGEGAAALFLSEKTVETHLRHLFGKLGVSSPASVGRALAGGAGPDAIGA